MKVRELLSLLHNKHPDALVILSTDTEGNSFQELGGITLSTFHDGEIYELCDISNEDKEHPDFNNKYQASVVFWPR